MTPAENLKLAFAKHMLLPLHPPHLQNCDPATFPSVTSALQALSADGAIDFFESSKAMRNLRYRRPDKTRKDGGIWRHAYFMPAPKSLVEALSPEQVEQIDFMIRKGPGDHTEAEVKISGDQLTH